MMSQTVSVSTALSRMRPLAVAVVATAATVATAVARRQKASGRSGTRGDSRVAAEHGNAGTVLRTTERDHVLANVRGHELSVVAAAVGEYVLNQVVSKLISSD